MIPKLQCPSFDGSNPRMWIKKCTRYFNLCKIPDDAKVELASLYMINKAEMWASSYMTNRGTVDWDEFKLDVVARFKDDNVSNVVENFNKLSQLTSLEDYIDDFENLRCVLDQNGHKLTEGYLLESFVGGLKKEVKPFVKAFEPTSISDAIKYARLQEEQLAANFTKLMAKPLQILPADNHKSKPILNTKPYQSFTNKPFTHSNVSKPPLLPTPPHQTLPKFPSRPYTHVPNLVRAEKMANVFATIVMKSMTKPTNANLKSHNYF